MTYHESLVAMLYETMLVREWMSIERFKVRTSIHDDFEPPTAYSALMCVNVITTRKSRRARLHGSIILESVGRQRAPFGWSSLPRPRVFRQMNGYIYIYPLVVTVSTSKRRSAWHFLVALLITPTQGQPLLFASALVQNS